MEEPSGYLAFLPQGIVTVPRDSYLAWLPLFYALPRELVEKRPAYLDLPRNIRQLASEDRYIDLINQDSFLELVWDCYAWSIWQYIQVPKKGGGYQDIPGDWSHYSGDFPLWRMSYDLIRYFREAFEYEMDWSFQKLFNAPEGVDVPWLSYQQFSNLVGNLTDKIIAEQNLQPIIDAVWENRQPEDYNRGKNINKRDFLRSWNHDRSHAHLSLEEIAETGAVINGEDLYELADPRAEFETKIISEAQVQQFQKSLSETDMRILQMRMEGSTMQEIADAVGLKTASAVKKHISKISSAYEAFINRQYDDFLDDHSN